MIHHVKRIIHQHHHRLPYLVWIVALLSLVGSLALSEVWKLVPCDLCWWQRILMYPMVVTVGVGILRRDANWVYYTFPLALAGVLVAAYHSLLQWGIIPETVASCRVGVSCVTRQLDVFGFVTIPFLSFLAFLAVTVVTGVFIWLKPSKQG